MRRHRTTVAEKAKIVRWLRRHSGVAVYGAQCKRHRPVSEMTDVETLAAMESELKLRCSRAWLIDLCRAEAIPRRGRAGPPPRGRQTSTGRWTRWVSNLKERDPERYKTYMAGKNAARKRPAATSAA